ncbi:unnamed protein product [Periconia digitata]|uniref:F-box domain-containing protein n=1 Tax=Periconia digitata TaxID=1303443 RepID=A0A9W4UNQ1_9PLEO|nr:unnamed protein product [Periconia digitata]
MAKKNTLSGLPDELQLTIFELVSAQDKCNLRLTCKKFAEVVMSIVLGPKYKPLHLHFNVLESDLRVLRVLLDNDMIKTRKIKLSLCCATFDGFRNIRPTLASICYPLAMGNRVCYSNPSLTEYKLEYKRIESTRVDLPVVEQLQGALHRIAVLDNVSFDFGCTLAPGHIEELPWKLRRQLKKAWEQDLDISGYYDTFDDYYDATSEFLKVQSCEQSLHLDWCLHILFKALSGTGTLRKNINFILKGHCAFFELEVNSDLDEQFHQYLLDLEMLEGEELDECVAIAAYRCAQMTSEYLSLRVDSRKGSLKKLRDATMSVTLLDISDGDVSRPDPYHDSSISYSKLIQILYQAVKPGIPIFRMENTLTSGYGPASSAHWIAPHELGNVRRLELINFYLPNYKPIAKMIMLGPRLRCLTMQMGFIRNGKWGDVLQIFRKLVLEPKGMSRLLHYLHLKDLYQAPDAERVEYGKVDGEFCSPEFLAKNKDEFLGFANNLGGLLEVEPANDHFGDDNEPYDRVVFFK